VVGERGVQFAEVGCDDGVQSVAKVVFAFERRAGDGCAENRSPE